MNKYFIGQISRIKELDGCFVSAYCSRDGSLYAVRANQIVRIEGLASPAIDESGWRQLLLDIAGLHTFLDALPLACTTSPVFTSADVRGMQIGEPTKQAYYC
jgi:hypothetical protein